MKKKTKTHLFSVFGIEVNLDSVLTTIAGFVSVSLISAGLAWLHDVKTAVKTDLPQLKSDVSSIKTEQARIRKEYAPPVPKL